MNIQQQDPSIIHITSHLKIVHEMIEAAECEIIMDEEGNILDGNMKLTKYLLFDNGIEVEYDGDKFWNCAENLPDDEDAIRCRSMLEYTVTLRQLDKDVFQLIEIRQNQTVYFSCEEC
jgi:hypothetical protein